MDIFLAEFLGTAILVLLGNGVVANVVLSQTKGHGSGWIVITAGWGFAVFTAVLCVGEFSGAHLNPAVTIGLTAAGEFDASQAPGYIVAQLAGGIAGAVLVYLFYLPHFRVTDDADAKLATFCTGPAIRMLPHNLFCEIVGTFVLVFGVLLTVDPSFQLADQPDIKVGLGSIGSIRVGLIVFVIGLSLGGTTGYAINPARDLGPRIVHWIVPIPAKRDSDWIYAVVPVVGPCLGALAAAGLFLACAE